MRELLIKLNVKKALVYTGYVMAALMVVLPFFDILNSFDNMFLFSVLGLSATIRNYISGGLILIGFIFIYFSWLIYIMKNAKI